MGSKRSSSSAALFLALNLLLFFSHQGGATTTSSSCPLDALQLGACVDLLGLLNLKIGNPPTESCCSLIQGLADVQVAACLCTTVNLSLLHLINLDVDLSLSLLVNACSAKIPAGWKCPS